MYESVAKLPCGKVSVAKLLCGEVTGNRLEYQPGLLHQSSAVPDCLFVSIHDGAVMLDLCPVVIIKTLLHRTACLFLVQFSLCFCQAMQCFARRQRKDTVVIKPAATLPKRAKTL